MGGNLHLFQETENEQDIYGAGRILGVGLGSLSAGVEQPGRERLEAPEAV